MAQEGREKAVQETLVSFFGALSNRDSVAMKQLSTSDLRLIEYGTIWNMDTLIRKGIRMNTSPDFSRADSIVFMTTHVMDRSALVTYQLFSRITRSGSRNDVHWIESATLVFEDNRWKLKFLHSTLLKRSNQ